MDEFDRLLEKYWQAKKAEPCVRTPGCPSDEELYELCWEGKGGALRQKYLDHVISCNYCARFVGELIETKIRLSESKKKMFPLAEEIDWHRIQTIELFKDNSSISRLDNVHGLAEVDFYISEPGFYHIVIDTGQIIWKREIAEGDIYLTDKEQEEAMERGMAASTEGATFRITGFDESHWQGRLRVVLLKRPNRGKLVFEFNRSSESAGK